MTKMENKKVKGHKHNFGKRKRGKVITKKQKGEDRNIKKRKYIETL